ncbi:MAG TPA: alpha/beta hydrolase, partial [Polyangiaceae bacterium]|nr:alpha/beta hydrolase [Polyangiaceae bacterium]
TPETAGLTASAPPREKLPTPAEVEAVPVPGDSPASLVRARGGGPPAIVFLPGVCSNAAAYLHTFPEAAASHGGVVAIDGDEPCVGAPGFHTFSWDTQKQHRRLEAALAAAGATAPREGGVTLVGYSQGATIGEKLVYAYPERYTRVVLIAAPVDPSVTALRSARAAVTCACSLDVTLRMRTAATRLTAGGVPATYVEMPGCTHGNVANGEETFGAAFAWLDGHARDAGPP